MGEERSRKAKDIGSESPASEEAKEQGMSGDRGAQAGRQSPEVEPQPAQASNRAPSKEHQQEPEVRKHFPPGRAPSEQGEKGHPSPEVIKSHQQGLEPTSGSHSAHGERTEEEAQTGDPAEDHTRHGRQSVPGHRPGHRS